MKKNLLLLSAVALSCLMILSCSTYYKSNSMNTPPSASGLDNLRGSGRVLIFRNGDEAWYIKSMELSADQKIAHCVLDVLPSNHMLHVSQGNTGNMKYQRKDLNEAGVVNEVHFYTAKDTTAAVGNYTLSLEKIFKIEVLEHDTKRTKNSHTLGVIGVTVGIAALAAIIIAVTKSSCPFISAYDGNDFSLQGEIYGGAIYPQLVRKDYLPLNMKPLPDGSLQLKITNELKERQYTDYVKLWKISHPRGTKVFVDEEGNLLSVTDPQQPVEAVLNENKNVLPLLQAANDYGVVYMDDSTRTNARNEIKLKFKKPAGAGSGKLILSLKNSYFLDLLYGELAKGFGTYYATYTAQQKKKSKEELLKWVSDQQIPLAVSVSTGRGQQSVANLTTVGPLAFRETAIQVDLSNVTGDEVEITLGSGFMFWEIDYAAMDFTNDIGFQVEKINPSSAIDENGKNVLSQLVEEDGKYLEQPIIGNAATISFKSNTASDNGMLQTHILESKGYYEHIRDFSNPPDLKFLEQFKTPGAFSKFGLTQYRKMSKESHIAAKSN